LQRGASFSRRVSHRRIAAGHISKHTAPKSSLPGPDLKSLPWHLHCFKHLKVCCKTNLWIHGPPACAAIVRKWFGRVPEFFDAPRWLNPCGDKKMIDSIGSSTSMQFPPTRTQQSLTSEQESLISETLAKYDTENLSAEDASSIVETLKEAGIEPGQALEQALSNEGVDAKELGDMAKAGGPPGGPPPPPPGGEETETTEATSIMDYLETLLEEQEDISDMTDTDKQELYSQVLEHFGLTQGESLINMQA
jgi:hypothetical protein